MTIVVPAWLLWTGVSVLAAIVAGLAILGVAVIYYLKDGANINW